MNSIQPSFDGLGIAPSIITILDRLKFTTPTQIQLKAIPLGLEGKDVMGIAQTGTGKTMAFGIPILQRLAQIKGRALVVVPTRELAIQVDESLRKIAPAIGVRSAVLIGGDSMGKQVQSLRLNPRVIIGTPGRLIDHVQQKTLKLQDIQIVVLDEADRMLDMGFAPQIKNIMQHVSPDRQTMLFSATMPMTVMDIAKSYMKLPVQVEIAPAGTLSENITQELFIVRKELKHELLVSVLGQYHGPVLVFCRTKFGCAKLNRALRTTNIKAAEIHSDRSLSQRKEALEGFKRGQYRVLVATDIAARGIDVKGIELVINFDLPDDAENYIHRIGRTGRASHRGHAISFATPDQKSDVRTIEKVMNKALPIASSHPTVPLEQFEHSGGHSGPRKDHYRNKSKSSGFKGHSKSGGFRSSGHKSHRKPGSFRPRHS